MISKAGSVAEYIAELSPERRAALEKLRKLCKKCLKGHQESMDYGMPVYKLNGVADVSFASQKQYIALYILKKEVLDEFRSRLGKLNVGKGCIRFTKPDQIDFGLVEEMLIRSAESQSLPC